MLPHNLSHSALFECCAWPVVDAIPNKCPGLKILFPQRHQKQREIAQGFRQVSDVAFDICAGAIDGITITWLEKAFESECKKLKCGAAKFFCGRKNKFGLKMQAICDAECRFLEIWIAHLASSSDFLSFAMSDFYKKCSAQDFWLRAW
jgi:hypothetical protein